MYFLYKCVLRFKSKESIKRICERREFHNEKFSESMVFLGGWFVISKLFIFNM